MTYKDTAYYYRLLGLASGADLVAVKKAYRLKAKQLHPDRNPSPTAHEDFVALTEAYEALVQWLSTGQTYSSQPQQAYYDVRQQARERAQAEAQKRYQDFINSDFYKTTQAGNTVASHLYLLVSALLIGGIAVMAGYYNGIWAVLAIIAALALISPILKWTVFEAVDLNPLRFWKSLKIVLKVRGVQTVLLTILNVVLFFKVTLSTLLTASLLFSLLFLFITATMALSRFLDAEQKVVSRYFAALGIAPLALNLFFTVNLLFGGPAYYETYRFERYVEISDRGISPTSMIVLEGDAYSNYPWLRFFANYEEANEGSNITYTFKRGLFGIKVTTGHQFW